MKFRWIRKVFVFCLVGIMVFGMTITTNAAQGWEFKDDNWYYIDQNGKPETGWKKISDVWYLFDNSGVMLTGWQVVNGKCFYLQPSGALYIGWMQLSTGQWIYFDEDEGLLIGRQYIEDNKGYFFFDSEGIMLTGWQKVDGTWRFYDLGSGKEHELEKGDCLNVNGYRYGVDVSHWQGNINWQQVKNSGISFAFIKCGGSDAGYYEDSYFEKNIIAANNNNISAGVYYYSAALNESQAIVEAQIVIDMLRGHKVTYPVAIDVEDAKQKKLSKQQLTNVVKAFCDEIAKAGYTPMVYCSDSWVNNNIDFSQLPGVKKWFACWDTFPNSSKSRDIWQAGSTCRINGISGNVDIDFEFVNCSFTPRTGPVAGYTKTTGIWKKDNYGWWYAYLYGGYPKSKWECINGAWYYFNDKGYILTNTWFYSGNKWYYLNGNGAMLTGMQKISGKTYYFNSSGAMQTGWQKINGKWYYFDISGAMMTGWIKLGNIWYYLNSNGVMATGWQKVSGTWYYLNSSGAMQVGWQKINGTWYYLNGSGAMTTGWLKQGNTWYFLTDSGAMATGWLWNKNNWYYLSGSGAMQVGWQKVNGKWYYLSASGAMLKNTYVGQYYVGSDGAWVY